ncbi:hypothetical protein BOSEA31B_12612 [Hyphomicrobiales bacterium]|nr:hypothetical protein BOSEA31B_12612 [Hyphomicrobiales bacterium]CAH1698381.1 hypothetical protein BOSEA1005_11434 [Hyphomicrobiales bacterium]CAI0342034.1 transposase [Hyphomicrobiales bacterium]
MEEAMLDLYWLSDDAWARLEPHLPYNQPGRPRVDDRHVISGILHILKTGSRWRNVPPEYGPAKTIFNRYTRWAHRGVWQRIFAKVAAAGAILDELMLDNSHVKAHRSAFGETEGPRQRIGGVDAGGRRIEGRPNDQNPLSGRCLRQDRRQHTDTRKHRRHQHGHALAGGDRAGQAPPRRQGL